MRRCHVLLDDTIFVADSDATSSGAFDCSSLSTVVVDEGATIDVTSATINLLCNISGNGDVALSCDNGNKMAVGGDSNIYDSEAFYHLANDELALIRSSASVTFGSAVKNVAAILLDGVQWTTNASAVSLVASGGSIAFCNTSSSVSLTRRSAAMSMTSKQDVSIEASTLLAFSGGGSPLLSIIADSDCSLTGSDHFRVSESAAFTFDTVGGSVVISAPSIVLSEAFNTTFADIVKFDRALD